MNFIEGAFGLAHRVNTTLTLIEVDIPISWITRCVITMVAISIISCPSPFLPLPKYLGKKVL